MENISLDAAVAALCPPDLQFRPLIYYSDAGDCVEYKAAPEDFDAVRVDSLLTLYYSRRTNQIIGSKINKVSQIAERVSTFRVIVREDGNVKLDHLIVSASTAASGKLERIYEPQYRTAIEFAAKANQEVHLPPRFLPLAHTPSA